MKHYSVYTRKEQRDLNHPVNKSVNLTHVLDKFFDKNMQFKICSQNQNAMYTCYNCSTLPGQRVTRIYLPVLTLKYRLISEHCRYIIDIIGIVFLFFTLIYLFAVVNRYLYWLLLMFDVVVDFCFLFLGIVVLSSWTFVYEQRSGTILTIWRLCL